MTQYQSAYHQPLSNEDEPIIDPSEIQRTMNWQTRGSQQPSQRQRSNARMSPHLTTHKRQYNGSIYGPISLCSPSPDRVPRKRAASQAPTDRRSSKKPHRAGSVYGQSPADKIKMEYQNHINLRDANMHGPSSPFKHRNSNSRTPVSAEAQSRLDELQRKRENLIAQTMAAHKEQIDSIVAEEQQLLMPNGISPNDSILNGGYGSPNGMPPPPSPTRNGFDNLYLGPQLSPRVENGHVNGNLASMPSVFGNHPHDFKNLPARQESAKPILQPAIWDSGGSSGSPSPAWQELENRSSSIANRFASRAQSVAPPTQRRTTGTRGKSVGPTMYRRVEGDSRLVNMHTGQWASSSDEDDALPPPPTTGRAQRAQTVGPSGASRGNNEISMGIPIGGIHSPQFQQQSQANANGNRAQEPVTPQRTAVTQNSQHTSSSNFVTPPEFPQIPRGPVNFINNSPNGQNPEAEPVTPQNKVQIPYPTSDSGSLQEHFQHARLRAHSTNRTPQYANDLPKGGIAFVARKKKEPITPAQHFQKEVIDLISSDGSEPNRRLPVGEPFPEPPYIEKPMKDRISKPGARKRGKSVAPEAPVDPLIKEQKRQERAATMILEKERKAEEGSIFGDDPIEEENKKAEERQRLIKQKEERQKAAALEKESRELEQCRVQAAQQAKAEEVQRQKEVQESKNRIRREAERKAGEAQEARGRDERREAALARIEAERKKKEEAKLETEKKKQRENEIQVKTKLLEEQKAKQEALKKQVSGIKASKISSDDSSLIYLGDNQAAEKSQQTDKSKEKEVANNGEPSTNTINGTNGTNSKGVLNVEGSALFVPANVPPSHDGTEAVTTAPPKDKQPFAFDHSGLNNMYDLDMRTLRGKSKGPTTAVEMMALAQAQKAKQERARNIENQRDIRESELDARRIAGKIQARRVRREREKSAPPPVFPRRPEPKPRESASQPESKETKGPAKPRATKGRGNNIERQLTSAIFPKFIPENYAEPPPRAKKVTATIPKEPAAKPANLLSDEERARHEAEQKKKEALEHEKQVAAKALEREERTRAYNEKNRKRATEVAREKQRLKLIEEAEKNGVELPQVELMSKLEDFMEARERRKRKTAATRATKENIKNFGNDSLARLASQTNNNEDIEDSEDDSPGTLERKARQRMLRETLHSMSQGRKSQLSQPIRMTCANESDSDSSDASEEDPDTPQGSDASDSENDDDDVATSQTSQVTRLDGDELGTQIEEPVTSVQPKKKGRKQKPIMTCIDDPENCVRVYTIMERKIVNGVFHLPSIRQSYLNYNESVAGIKDMINRLKEAKPVSSQEAWEGDFLQATITYDDEGDNILEIWLTQQFKSKDMNPADFNMNEIKQLRHMEKSYFVKSTITTRTTNAETGVVKDVVGVQHLKHWSDIDLANNDAVDVLIKYAKPPKPIVDHFAIYDGEFVPSVRKVRNDLEYLNCFYLEMTRGESGEGLEALKWISEDVINVIFEVELYYMKGPLN